MQETRVAVEKNAYYILSVSDNGIGLSEGIDLFNSETLGLRLVKNLTNQLEGAVNFDGTTGTAFRIRFRRHEVR